MKTINSKIGYIKPMLCNFYLDLFCFFFFSLHHVLNFIFLKMILQVTIFIAKPPTFVFSCVINFAKYVDQQILL